MPTTFNYCLAVSSKAEQATLLRFSRYEMRPLQQNTDQFPRCNHSGAGPINVARPTNSGIDHAEHNPTVSQIF